MRRSMAYRVLMKPMAFSARRALGGGFVGSFFGFSEVYVCLPALGRVARGRIKQPLFTGGGPPGQPFV